MNQSNLCGDMIIQNYVKEYNMAHPEQQQFMLSVKSKFPASFDKVRVLDIGSLNINEDNRYLFTNYEYIGLDLGMGKNVDVVCRGHEYKDEKLFDTIISTECFEHDEYWPLTIINAISLLKPVGLFAFTCAAEGRQEHGTKRTSPSDSPFTCLLPTDYYKNLSENEMKRNIHFDKYFSEYYFKQIHTWPQDLYFWGIKHAS